MKMFNVNFSLPIEWFDRLFSFLQNGEVSFRKGENIQIKGSWFEVILVSEEGVMLKAKKGTKVIIV